MTGMPKKRQMQRTILKWGGEDWMLNEIASGVSVVELSKRLKRSRGEIYKYFNETPERKARFAEARKTSAHSLVEDATEIVDETEGAQMQVEVTSAKERAGHRRWLAERYNREDYGAPDPTIQVQVNVATLHLDALKAHGGPRKLPVAEIPEVATLEPHGTAQEE